MPTIIYYKIEYFFMFRIILLKLLFTKYSLFFVLLTIVLLPSTGTPKEDNELVIGYEEWSPYSYHNENHQLVGLDIEIATLILTRMSKKFTFREAPSKRILSELKKGGPSTVGTSSFKRSEREEYAYFSDVYRNESIVMMVKKDNLPSFPYKTLTDLVGINFQIGVVRGAIYGEEYSKLIQNPVFVKQLQYVSSEEQSYRKLLNNRLDGVLGAYTTFLPIAIEKGILDAVVPLMTTETIPLRFIFSRKIFTLDFIRNFNIELKRFIRENGYQELFYKYGVLPNMLIQ